MLMSMDRAQGSQKHSMSLGHLESCMPNLIWLSVIDAITCSCHNLSIASDVRIRKHIEKSFPNGRKTSGIPVHVIFILWRGFCG